MTTPRAALMLFAAAAPVLAASPTASPTPVPPRLSGGFGRARATPVPTRPGGQSLADVVRAASETRQAKESPRPPIEINNKSLVTDPNRGKLSTSRVTPHAAPTATPAATHAAGAEAGPAAVPATNAENAEEARWKETARRARQRVAEARGDVARLEGEAKKLENDFYSWDDGLYRDNVIKPAWDKKREELDTARQELSDAEQDLADLPERARKAGALPGWIRE